MGRDGRPLIGSLPLEPEGGYRLDRAPSRSESVGKGTGEQSSSEILRSNGRKRLLSGEFASSPECESGQGHATLLKISGMLYSLIIFPAIP